jgi:hypothetical protein
LNEECPKVRVIASVFCDPLRTKGLAISFYPSEFTAKFNFGIASPGFDMACGLLNHRLAMTDEKDFCFSKISK